MLTTISSIDQLIQRFKSLPDDGDLYANFYYQEITDALIKSGQKGVLYLKNWIEQNDPKVLDLIGTARLRAVLFALSQVNSERDREWVKVLLLHYLEDERPEILAEAIDGLRHQKARYTIRVLMLLNHPSAQVRSSVLRFFAALHPNRALPLLLLALHDSDPLVRENAADELGDLGDRRAIQPLQELCQDSCQNVREAAESALEMFDNLKNS
jgi:hypothetical protein